MKNKRYLRYLNRHQREVYRYHCWHNGVLHTKVFTWCLEMFGDTHKRWQSKYFECDTGKPFAYKTLYLFRNQGDAVLFSLRWGS